MLSTARPTWPWHHLALLALYGNASPNLLHMASSRPAYLIWQGIFPLTSCGVTSPWLTHMEAPLPTYLTIATPLPTYLIWKHLSPRTSHGIASTYPLNYASANTPPCNPTPLCAGACSLRRCDLDRSSRAACNRVGFVNDSRRSALRSALCALLSAFARRSASGSAGARDPALPIPSSVGSPASICRARSV